MMYQKCLSVHELWNCFSATLLHCTEAEPLCENTVNTLDRLSSSSRKAIVCIIRWCCSDLKVQ